MKKLYGTINTELVDPNLEAKVVPEVQLDPILADVPTDLYAAIVSNAPSINVESHIEQSEVKTFTYTVPTRLYTQLVPEKPAILAEERIFVYVPKVAYNSAGIAKFATDQFNVNDGEVSMKQTYLDNLILSYLAKPDLIIIVTSLPVSGIVNKIYLVPDNSEWCLAYSWDSILQVWISLGSIAINLTGGNTLIAIGDTPPTDSNINFWINTDPNQEM